MSSRRTTLVRSTLLMSAAVAATLAMSSPAVAANDSFFADTLDACGRVNFVDHGPGAPGGGDNDDYVVIHDYCADGHGVKAYVWLNYRYLGGRYNGNGKAGAPVIWDPFPNGNVKGGGVVSLKVCRVDGNNDKTPSRCNNQVRVIVDG